MASMENIRICSKCVFICLYLLSWGSGAALESIPRGVSRARSSFYKPGIPFTCLDGSLTIPFEHINDDYCDCGDGSDEPGTAACKNGKFYCVNKGYKPENIPSSRVSDGVCDCCDGSDEYEFKVQCENTCIEEGKTMREELQAMKLLVEEGHRIRTEFAVQGQQAKVERQQLLVSLGPRRDELNKEKEELLAQKTAAEEPEAEAKKVHDTWWQEQLALKAAEAERTKVTEVFHELDTSQDKLITMVELQARDEFDTNTDGHVSEEEVTVLLGDAYDSIDLETFISTVWPKIKDVYKFPQVENADPIQAPPTDGASAPADTDGTAAPDAAVPPTEAAKEAEDDDSDFEEEDFNEEDDKEDEEKSTTPSGENLMPAYPDETQELIKVADAARAAYTDAENNYNEVDNKIQDIEKFLGLDLGPQDVFYVLRDQCYEFTDREYIYKFCPFDKATQRPKSGGSETNLGTFTKWEADGDDNYGFMKFEKGLNCWNGPDRSATVKFICGKENTLSNAAEPNRCEYSFDFTTPAACHILAEIDLDGPVPEHGHTEL